MSRWYRAYQGTVSDPKLAEVALIVGCSRSVVIAAWHSLLESAAGAQDNGRFDMTARRLAALLCEPVEIMASVISAMEEVGLVEGSALPAWKERQYESDNSTQRSRKHRERLKSVAESVCNADATLQGRCATPPDTETDTDLKKDPSGPKKRASRLPPDWKPGQAEIDYARRHGFSDAEISREGERFANHWHAKSGRDAAKLDWPATWRNWILRAAELRGKPPSAQAPPTRLQDPDWRARAEYFQRNGWRDAWGDQHDIPEQHRHLFTRQVAA